MYWHCSIRFGVSMKLNIPFSPSQFHLPASLACVYCYSLEKTVFISFLEKNSIPLITVRLYSTETSSWGSLQWERIFGLSVFHFMCHLMLDWSSFGCLCCVLSYFTCHCHARLIVILLSLLCPFLFHLSLSCSTYRYLAVFVVPFPISFLIAMLDWSLFGCICCALSYFICYCHAWLIDIWLSLLCPLISCGGILPDAEISTF